MSLMRERAEQFADGWLSDYRVASMNIFMEGARWGLEASRAIAEDAQDAVEVVEQITRLIDEDY